MEKKYSRVCKVRKRMFRYNYERCVVEYVFKVNKEMLADNVEWQAKYGKDLWEIEDGYCVADAVGLRKENWNNKELRLPYLEMWNDELDEEVAWEMYFFEKEEKNG